VSENLAEKSSETAAKAGDDKTAEGGAENTAPQKSVKRVRRNRGTRSARLDKTISAEVIKEGAEEGAKSATKDNIVTTDGKSA
jgi:hypothetical protein